MQAYRPHQTVWAAIGEGDRADSDAATIESDVVIVGFEDEVGVVTEHVAKIMFDFGKALPIVGQSMARRGFSPDHWIGVADHELDIVA